MVQTDTYAKVLSALASLAFLSFLFGIILYIIEGTSPYWMASWYNKHFHKHYGITTVKHKIYNAAAWFIAGAVIALVLIELFSQGYLDRRRKHEFILTHLQMQLENKI